MFALPFFLTTLFIGQEKTCNRIGFVTDFVFIERVSQTGPSRPTRPKKRPSWLLFTTFDFSTQEGSKWYCARAVKCKFSQVCVCCLAWLDFVCSHNRHTLRHKTLWLVPHYFCVFIHHYDNPHLVLLSTLIDSVWHVEFVSSSSENSRSLFRNEHSFCMSPFQVYLVSITGIPHDLFERFLRWFCLKQKLRHSTG